MADQVVEEVEFTPVKPGVVGEPMEGRMVEAKLSTGEVVKARKVGGNWEYPKGVHVQVVAWRPVQPTPEKPEGEVPPLGGGGRGTTRTATGRATTSPTTTSRSASGSS